jgi:hypothetical protein
MDAHRAQIAQIWIDSIFEARQAKEGGIVRRAIHSVEENASEKLLLDAVRKRGFHLVRTESQYLVFCNNGLMKLLI